MRRAMSAPERRRKSGSKTRSSLISDGGGAREAMPTFLYVYVENADEAYRRAIAAGAESIEPPADTPYGDRRATVRDSWANVWQIATYRSNP
ncbi:VOC family protein [Bradyrhizobium elkanii]|jgi:PhnB protein|uniref:Glyoxalase superfamily protein PhnB n=2 Tax=Bradyrhizobium elkanii TaxID=29448 RepID=A0ABV4F1S9_BRAEL|nr:VOC family protein [Bradyrhizobium elkanii]MBP2426773.1 putative glyoxalase superfamily protein PhnB [Bradyrhizobium elkanii]MCP1757973.1 putative glyoxalase superfamily protein PhnB [Bradyrhizobium elkanii]MCP1983290.1 putative glyoxalase superfamily protein PhnB [Bradyrhizobium elkanii]MCS3881730.1 putative glyoxalase superfamily protein PhnB [Bradyrhizobium elkanii]MCS4218489.1 putative glyoxalase superfamily protein PhnB [Bradyrhizobium elkanii]